MENLIFAVPFLVVALLAAPLLPGMRGKLTATQGRNRVIANLCLFVGVCAISVLLPAGGVAMAAEGTTVVNAIMGTNAQGMGFLAAAFVTGFATIGAGIAVAAAAPAAIGAVSEDPKSFGKAIIFVVLGEGIAIYGLLISILIINKL